MLWERCITCSKNLSYQKKEWRAGHCQSFIWYDNNKDLGAFYHDVVHMLCPFTTIFIQQQYSSQFMITCMRLGYKHFHSCETWQSAVWNCKNVQFVCKMFPWSTYTCRIKWSQVKTFVHLTRNVFWDHLTSSFKRSAITQANHIVCHPKYWSIQILCTSIQVHSKLHS